MSTINANSIQNLQQIAKMAYGSGRTEKTNGGTGYIGQIGNRVIKFATHGDERPLGGLEVSEEMTNSCNDLRLKIGTIAREVLGGRKDVATQSELASIYKSLGLTETGGVGAKLRGQKSLLSRKVVAKVLTAIEKSANRNVAENDRVDVWAAAKEATARDRHALTAGDTSFGTVSDLASAHNMAQASLEKLKNYKTPLDKILDAVLNGLRADAEASDPDRILLETEVRELRGRLARARENLVNSVKEHFTGIADNHSLSFRSQSTQDVNHEAAIHSIVQRQFFVEVDRAISGIDPRVSKSLLNFISNQWSNPSVGNGDDVKGYEHSTFDIGLDFKVNFSDFVTTLFSTRTAKTSNNGL